MALDQLRIFVTVAELQHVTQAARVLNKTQSAVSAAIRALEETYDITLFDRVGRSILLSSEGRQFLPHARNVLAAAGQAAIALSDMSDLLRGHLAIMASQTVVAHWLAPRLSVFHRRYPGIELSVEIGNTSAVVKAVADGQAELGLVEGDVDHPSLEVMEIGRDRLIVLATKDHPLTQKTRLTPKDVMEAAWVLRESGSGTRHCFDAFLAREGLTFEDVSVAMVLPGNEAVLGAVQEGVGVTLISELAAAPYLRAGDAIALASAPIERPFRLLVHRERLRSRAAHAFTAQLTSPETI